MVLKTRSRTVTFTWKRSLVLACAGIGVCLPPVAAKAVGPPVLLEGGAPDPIGIDHLPSRLHAFIWRNWESVELSRMAEVLGTSTENVARIGRSMGLPPHQPISELKQQRGYVSLIRRNWQLLNYEQLMQLLGWDADKLSHTLKEEDFLFFKLGLLKPKCPPLRYSPPTPEQERRAAAIAAVFERHFGQHAFAEPEEPRFAFVEYLSKPPAGPVGRAGGPADPVRFLYSYFALYGDSLSNPSIDPYPEGLLQRLAATGVNGVWLHTVLRELAPCPQFPEFGQGHELRLENLRRLVARAGKHGIKVYLYMNEPRSMPTAWFANHRDIEGHCDAVQGHTAMCTSAPVVRAFIKESLAFVFREVPDLGGVFTITMVENLTNCHSRANNKPPQCPRCSKRTAAEVIAEVNSTIAEGVHAGNPKAKALIWDWVWEDAWSEPIIGNLPKDAYLMSVSEWNLPIERGGVKTVAGEYSLSAVGPGERALRNWRIARANGMKTIAKVQLNCSWELSVVPYLPVMDLVAEHLERLTSSGVDGLMLSWSLGGYPSPNLSLLKRYNSPPPPDRETVLTELANERFGPQAGADARKAWHVFSSAFKEYPFHITSLYNSPVQLGPANLLYPKQTGYHSTMVGFAYDDLDQWRAIYPAEVFGRQFERVASGWQIGLNHMRDALQHATSEVCRRNALEDLRIAEAAYTHFQAVANQTWFTDSRNALASGTPSPDERARHIERMTKAVRSEIELAKRLFVLTRQDSRIGFEATNHYNYYPLDLVEKVINCQYLLDEWLPAQDGPR